MSLLSGICRSGLLLQLKFIVVSMTEYSLIHETSQSSALMGRALERQTRAVKMVHVGLHSVAHRGGCAGKYMVQSLVEPLRSAWHILVAGR